VPCTGRMPGPERKSHDAVQGRWGQRLRFIDRVRLTVNGLDAVRSAS
jgi:hypothetical protein